MVSHVTEARWVPAGTRWGPPAATDAAAGPVYSGVAEGGQANAVTSDESGVILSVSGFGPVPQSGRRMRNARFMKSGRPG